MNAQYYNDIYEEFKNHHPYAVDDVADWRPRGEYGIRLIMKDGTKYDFDKLSMGIRKVDNYSFESKDAITDEQCRASFSYHLVELMALRGFTQQTLSEYTGISKGSINGYINKTKTPSMTNMRKIAYALNCPIGELLD